MNCTLPTTVLPRILFLFIFFFLTNKKTKPKQCCALVQRALLILLAVQSLHRVFACWMKNPTGESSACTAIDPLTQKPVHDLSATLNLWKKRFDRRPKPSLAASTKKAIQRLLLCLTFSSNGCVATTPTTTKEGGPARQLAAMRRIGRQLALPAKLVRRIHHGPQCRGRLLRRRWRAAVADVPPRRSRER